MKQNNFTHGYAQQSAIKTAREFVNAVVASGFLLKKAILFGWYIRSERRSHSDIDLAGGPMILSA